MLFDKILAAIGLLACAALWAGMALGPLRRQRLLAWARRTWNTLRGWRGWRARRAAQLGALQSADQAAQAIIERARRRPQVAREGNVYRPRAFGSGEDNSDDKTLH